jgi:hypothetical protein
MLQGTSLAVAVVAVLIAASAPAQAQPPCDKATATPLVQPTDPNINGRLVEAVHCGAFLGPGSEAMLVVVAPQGGCAVIGAWQLFVLVDGVWQPSADGYHEDAHDGLTVDGVTITEARDIRRRHEWVGCGGATGGRQQRSWTWDGSAGLAAGAWTEVVPARPKGEVAHVPRPRRGTARFSFRHLRGGLFCGISDGRRSGASCQHPAPNPNSTAQLRSSGQVRTCTAPHGQQACVAGNPGVIDFPYRLHAGESVVVGRFRCRGLRTAVRCTITRTGKGFEIGRNGARRIG